MRDGTRTACLAAPVVALALLVTGCGTDDEPSVRVDHKTASSAPAAQAAVDPAAGMMTRAWRTRLRGKFDVALTKFAFTPGQLLTISSRGVDALATGDGKARWHYYEPGRPVSGYALTGGTVVLLTQGSTPRTVALDAATGEELWHSTEFEPLTNLAELAQASGQGVVALADAENSSMLVGVDARTGERRWEWPGFKSGSHGLASCRFRPYDSDGGLLLVDTICFENEERLVALDPGTGKPRWQRPVSDLLSWATSRAGLTLVPAEEDGFRGVVLLGRDGRELRRLPADTPYSITSGSLAVTAGRAVLRYGPHGGSGGRLASVDTRTGEVRGSADTGSVGALAVGSGHVYAQRHHLADEDDPFKAATPLPGALEAVDPRTLDITRLPLPSPAVSGFWVPGREPSNTSRALPYGGRAYVVEIVPGGLRLSGYAPGTPASPPTLGGVPARDWPDACELGNGLDNAYPPNAEPPLRVGKERISKWSCGFASKDGGGDDVWTAWVARDTAEADRLLDPADSPRRPPTPIAGLGDEAYALPKWMGNPSIALRVGRHIVVVEATRNRDPRTLAEVVVRNLRRLS